jgi:hypothetical protein
MHCILFFSSYSTLATSPMNPRFALYLREVSSDRLGISGVSALHHLSNDRKYYQRISDASDVFIICLRPTLSLSMLCSVSAYCPGDSSNSARSRFRCCVSTTRCTHVSEEIAPSMDPRENTHFFKSICHDEAYGGDFFLLTHSMHTREGLLLDSGIPLRLEYVRS